MSWVEGRYDLIIGSDLLYERDDRAVLSGFIGRHADEGCEVWIVDPNRSNRGAFHRNMARFGFEMREDRLEHPAAAGAEAYKGRMLTYRR